MTDQKLSKKPRRSSRSSAVTASRSQVDHLDPDQLRRLAGRLRDEYGRIDILVNGIWGAEILKGPPHQWNTPIWEHDLTAGLHILRLGLDTHLMTSHWLLPLLIARPLRVRQPVDGDLDQIGPDALQPTVGHVSPVGARIRRHRRRRLAARQLGSVIRSIDDQVRLHPLDPAPLRGAHQRDAVGSLRRRAARVLARLTDVVHSVQRVGADPEPGVDRWPLVGDPVTLHGLAAPAAPEDESVRVVAG